MCIFYEFLAGIKQLYEWFGPSVRHTFFTMFPGDSSRENQGRRPTLLLSLRPQGHAFNIACSAIIKTYNSMLPVSLCDNGCWGTSMVASEICEKCTVGLDLFNDDTCPEGHISRPTQVNVFQSCFNSLNKLLKLNYIVQVWELVEVNCVISDRRIISDRIAGIPLCKSRELSWRGYSMSQLCGIHHDIPVTLHTPGAYGQWSVFDHNGDKQSAVLGTRYGTRWPLFGWFEVRWLQPLQLWLSAGISSVAPVLVLRNSDLCHVQLHPTWFEPAAGCRSWPVVSNLHCGHPPEDLSWSWVSFASWSTLSFPSMPQWLGIQQKQICVPLSFNNKSRFMIWQIKGFSVSSPSIACKQDIESE